MGKGGVVMVGGGDLWPISHVHTCMHSRVPTTVPSTKIQHSGSLKLKVSITILSYRN
jgi:hypothetical protein